MKNIYLITLLCLGFFILTYAQPQKSVKEADSIINVNSALKMEVLTLKRKVVQLESRVNNLEGQVNNLSGQVNSLRKTNNKTQKEYKELELMAKTILAKNDSLNQANDELENMNQRIKQSKENVQIAAKALEQVLDNEGQKTALITNSFKKNFVRGCTNVTHNSKRGNVVLDEQNVHKLAWIDDFKVNINTCFALPKAEATPNVKVYLTVEKISGKTQLLESNKPILLTPNMTVSDESVTYYEGNIIVALPQNSRRELKSTFKYHIDYLEEEIASGSFRLE